MTAPQSFYVNSLIPDTIFEGRDQGSLPLTSGRWFLIPLEIVTAHPDVRRDPLAPARAHSLLPDDSPTTMVAWTAGG